MCACLRKCASFVIVARVIVFVMLLATCCAVLLLHDRVHRVWLTPENSGAPLRTCPCGCVRSRALVRPHPVLCVSAIRLCFVWSRCNAFRVLSIRSRAPLVVRARGQGGESAVLRVIVLCNADNALRGIVAVSVRRECVSVFTSVYRFVSCMCGRADARGYGANSSCCNGGFLVKLRGASACPCMCGVHDSTFFVW